MTQHYCNKCKHIQPDEMNELQYAKCKAIRTPIGELKYCSTVRRDRPDTCERYELKEKAPFVRINCTHIPVSKPSKIELWFKEMWRRISHPGD